MELSEILNEVVRGDLRYEYEVEQIVFSSKYQREIGQYKEEYLLHLSDDEYDTFMTRIKQQKWWVKQHIDGGIPQKWKLSQELRDGSQFGGPSTTSIASVTENEPTIKVFIWSSYNKILFYGLFLPLTIPLLGVLDLILPHKAVALTILTASILTQPLLLLFLTFHFLVFMFSRSKDHRNKVTQPYYYMISNIYLYLSVWGALENYIILQFFSYDFGLIIGSIVPFISYLFFMVNRNIAFKPLELPMS